MHRNIEEVAVGIHGAIFGEWPRRRPLTHRLIPLGKLFLDILQVLDLKAEMVDSARGCFAAIAQNRERQIAVAHIRGAAALGMDDLHPEDFLVEFGKPCRVLGLDGEVADLRHCILRLRSMCLVRCYGKPTCRSN